MNKVEIAEALRKMDRESAKFFIAQLAKLFGGEVHFDGVKYEA